MSTPDKKDKNRQGSPGRPGTKFMERPTTQSGAGKDEAQEGSQFGEEGVLDQQEKPTGEETKGDRYSAPKPQEPGKKTDRDKGGQKDEGNDKDSEQGMGKEE